MSGIFDIQGQLPRDRHFYQNVMVDLENYFAYTEIDTQMLQDRATVALLQIRAVVLGERLAQIRFPKNWWQHFRQRWFPQWWLEKWPVQEEVFNVDAMQPKHLNGDGYLAVYRKGRLGFPEFEDIPEENER